MRGINVSRWIAGGVVAAIVLFIIEGLAAMIYADEAAAAMREHGLSMELNGTNLVIGIVLSLLCGLTIVFFYAASRARFGAGPMTAIMVGFALWVGSYLPSLLAFYMMGLYSAGLIVVWALGGLIEMVLAALAGGWVYREPDAAILSPAATL